MIHRLLIEETTRYAVTVVVPDDTPQEDIETFAHESIADRAPDVVACETSSSVITSERLWRHVIRAEDKDGLGVTWATDDHDEAERHFDTACERLPGVAWISWRTRKETARKGYLVKGYMGDADARHQPAHRADDAYLGLPALTLERQP